MSDPAAAKVFDALGDPTRRLIVEALRSGPMAVGTLAGRLPVRRPAVSKHLHVLEGAGLVEHERVGTRHLYALAPEGLVAAQRWLVDALDEVLKAFSDHTTRLAARTSTTRPQPKTTAERSDRESSPFRRSGVRSACQ